MDAGTHAREWLGPTTLLYMAYQVKRILLCETNRRINRDLLDCRRQRQVSEGRGGLSPRAQTSFGAVRLAVLVQPESGRIRLHLEQCS